MSNIKKEDLVKDVLKGITDTAEISEVVKWFATNEGQNFLSNDIDESIESLLQGGDSELVSVSRIPSDKMLTRINRQIRFRQIRRISLRAAAVMVPFILLMGFIGYANSMRSLSDEAYAEIYVPKGAQRQITLEDGSQIYLGSDTRFRYPKNFSSEVRRVHLEGEGYFIVEKNPKRPFVIEIDDVEVKVLGTSFNVEAYPEDSRITLQLDEGSIKLTASSSQKGYVMVPGEKLIYSRKDGNGTISRTKNESALKNWENQTFSFDNTPLRQVLETIKHWHEVDFQMYTEEVWKYSYTFESGKDSLEEILSDMEKVSPIQFKREGKTIKISMK